MTRSQTAEQSREKSANRVLVVGEKLGSLLPGRSSRRIEMFRRSGSNEYAVDASDYSVGFNLLFNNVSDNSLDKAVTVNELLACSIMT